VNIVNRHHVGLKALLVRVLRARRRSGKCRIVDFSSRKRATRICRDHTATSLRSGKSGVLALSLPSRALSGANSSGVFLQQQRGARLELGFALDKDVFCTSVGVFYKVPDRHVDLPACILGI